VDVQRSLRPSLVQAVESVLAQRDAGRIRVLIGIDVAQGDLALIERLGADCPTHVTRTPLLL